MSNASSLRRANASLPVPPRWRKDVERVLITDKQLAKRIRQMARQIERDFQDREMVVVSLLNGTVMFIGDLIRHLSHPLRLDFMGVSSYGKGTESGELVFTKELRLDVKGRDVLIVDDILDTGATLAYLAEMFAAREPASIKTCVMVRKAKPEAVPALVDYVGFEIPDEWVVGYGLDYADRFRTLPYIATVEPGTG